MALPNILRNFNLFVDGRGYSGRVEELTLPKLAIKTEEHRAGGMDAPVELDMGMEKIECDFTLCEYSPDVLKLFGLADGSAVQLTLRGGLEADNGDVESIVVQLRGMLREVEGGTWKGGEKATLKCMVSCRYYKLQIDEEIIHEIDVENMVRVIDGEDQLSAMRDAIGL